MNRIIRFRGKRVDNGEWVYGNPTDNLFGEPLIEYRVEPRGPLCINGQERVKVIPESVGQFAELSDKNEKGIYEGDIVRVDEKVMLVQMLEGCWRTKYGAFTNYRLYGWVVRSLEVIGNIHEHPDLLK